MITVLRAALRFREGLLDRLVAMARGGPMLTMTAGFGRSPLRDAAYRLRTQRPDIDLKLSWRLFASLEDWAKRWRTERDSFAAGLILSTGGDLVVECVVGRCVPALVNLGRPLLWGVISSGRTRWYPRFSR